MTQNNEAIVEIKAALVNGYITNDKEVIYDCIKHGINVKLVDARILRFMQACDVGSQWDMIASGPTLFKLNADQYAEAKKLRMIYGAKNV